MKTCLICPIPSLDTFIDDDCTHHLLLTQLAKIPNYVDFYRERSRNGEYVIVDNGAKEEGTGFGMRHVLRMAMQTQASEVVLTDVRYEWRDTIEAGREGLYFLHTKPGRQLYEDAGNPKLMIVPQGRTIEEWLKCFHRLYDMVEYAQIEIREMPSPVVGFAYHYDHMFGAGIAGLLELVRVDPEVDFHMLGWPRRVESLQEISKNYPHVRSVDSGRPFSYAKAGVGIAPGSENAKRDPNFFTERIPAENENLTRYNINVFRDFARDDVKNTSGAR